MVYKPPISEFTSKNHLSEAFQPTIFHPRPFLFTLSVIISYRRDNRLSSSISEVRNTHEQSGVSCCWSVRRTSRTSALLSTSKAALPRREKLTKTLCFQYFDGEHCHTRFSRDNVLSRVYPIRTFAVLLHHPI